jgi:hypothetical protein
MGFRFEGFGFGFWVLGFRVLVWVLYQAVHPGPSPTMVSLILKP